MEALSLRYKPFWSPVSSYQKDGLIDFVNFIQNQNRNLVTWLEVGSYIGESAEIFLSFDFIKKLFCIDPWESTVDKKYLMSVSNNTYNQKLVKKTFFDRLNKEIESGRCVPLEGLSEDIYKTIDEKFDVIYIDANHSYESVTLDLYLWYRNLNVGGYMCGHDFVINKKSGVYSSTMAIQDFMNFISPHYGTYEFHVFKDGSWLFKKEEEILDIQKYKQDFKKAYKEYLKF